MSTTPEKKPAKRSSKIKIDPNNRIVIKGAREHNLKNVDLELPRDKLIVMTGLSGSGKSSLAFIYGVLEKPFRNYFEKAQRQPGMTGPNLMSTRSPACPRPSPSTRKQQATTLVPRWER